MINNDTLMAVQAEVTRFQAALDVVWAPKKRSWGEAYRGSPETAALRRASMDLTRALAELRSSPSLRQVHQGPARGGKPMTDWGKLRAERMIRGSFKGRPWWCNGYMLEFAKPPSELKADWVSPNAAEADALMEKVRAEKTQPILTIGRHQNWTDRLYFRAGEIYGTVNLYYWEYFQERYPDLEASTAAAEGIMHLMSKGELVGLIMPILAYQAKENYYASTITELRSSKATPINTALRSSVTFALPKEGSPHRCKDCADYYNAWFNFNDGTGDGVAVCFKEKWPNPRIRKISMVLRNRPPLREIGAKCEEWRHRP